MGILDNFEKGLERVVNGAFARTFKSGLQPVELASALRREIDTNAAIVARDRILVPNRFVLRMAASDLRRMEGLGSTLVDELTTMATEHAKKQGYRFPGPIDIRFADDAALADGMVEVDSSSAKGTVAWTPVLDIGDRRYTLERGRTVIGRGGDADITVDDTGISRKHVEVVWDGSRAEVHDLGSTNGSKLDGTPVTRAALAPEQTISIGRTRMVFRVVQGAAPRAEQQPERRGRSDGFWDDRL